MTDLADIVIRVDSTQLNNASSATITLRQSTLNLLGSLDRVAAAQLSHTNSLRTLNNALQQGIISQRDFARASDALRARLEAQGLTINNLGQIVSRNTGIFRRFGSSGMQQVGYQVGDFAVQVQGGTNALVALGQQGSQLLGIFGAGGAIAGAFLAVGTALANAYLGAAKFNKATNDLKTGISSLREEIDLLNSGASGIAKEFGIVAEGLAKTVRLIATVNIANALKDARTQLSALTKGLYTSENPLFKSTILSQSFESAKNFKRNFGMGQGQAEDMAGYELALARAKTDKERLDLLNSMTTELEKQVISGETISDEGITYLNSIATAQQNLQVVVALQDQLASAIKNSTDETSKQIELDRVRKNAFHAMAGEMGAVSSYMGKTANDANDITSNLNSATNAALNLRDALKEVSVASKSRVSQITQLTAEINAAKTGKSVAGAGAAAQTITSLSGSGATMDQMAAASAKASEEAALIEQLQKEKSSLLNPKKDSPKGASEATVENKLKALYEYLGETKKVNGYLIEEENIAYDQRGDLLKSALDKKLITLQEYQQMELDLTAMHQDALNKIESARQNQRLGDTATFFGGLADVAKAGGDKTVKAMRIFSAAQALINSYVAFTEVLKDPSLIGRPWARFGMAASALASGLSAVTAIKSGGGSVKGISSGGGSVGTSPASAESASPTTVMIQGMKPTDIFTGEQLSTLFDSLYKENNNRGMVFMVQR